MQIKKPAAGTVTAAAMGLALFGATTGVAQAKPHNPLPPVPGIDDVWHGPPGHNPYGPPGQVMQGNPVVPGLTGVPPGHWGDPVAFGLPAVWRPWNWVDLGILEPQPLVWNPGSNAWGIWWNGNFIGFVA